MQNAHPNGPMDAPGNPDDHRAMRNALGALVVACALGCNGGDMGADAGLDGAVTIDARETDGIPAIDGPPGPCPDVPVPAPTAATTPPGAGAGVLRVTWRCIGGCATYPAPELTRAAGLTIASGGGLTWSNGIVLESTVTGACRRVAADDADGCRGYFDVCAAGTGVTIAMATWYDRGTQWRQTWEATGVR